MKFKEIFLHSTQKSEPEVSKNWDRLVRCREQALILAQNRNLPQWGQIENSAFVINAIDGRYVGVSLLFFDITGMYHPVVETFLDADVEAIYDADIVQSIIAAAERVLHS